MKVNIILFDDFETLDAFGPAQIFGKLPEYFSINYLSVNGGIVNSTQGVKVWTEELEPDQIQDIVVIPGGRGAKKLLYLEKDILTLIKKSVEHSSYCMMVGNGSAIVSQTGCLYHRRIADYNYDENWKRMFTAGITRIPDVRCLADGKYYTCSSSMAGMELALGLVSDTVDIDIAERTAQEVGIAWDSENELNMLI